MLYPCNGGNRAPYYDFKLPLTSPFTKPYRTGSHHFRLSVTHQAKLLLLIIELKYSFKKHKKTLIAKDEDPWCHLY